jgi:hypothetical protein
VNRKSRGFGTETLKSNKLPKFFMKGKLVVVFASQYIMHKSNNSIIVSFNMKSMGS